MFSCGSRGLAFFAGTKKAKAVEYGISGAIKGRPGKGVKLLFTSLGGFVVEELNSYATGRLGANRHIEENTRADHNESN